MNVLTLPAPAIDVPASRIYGPPTQFLSVWTPRLLEAVSPPQVIESATLELQIIDGSTADTGIVVPGRNRPTPGPVRRRVRRWRARPHPTSPPPEPLDESATLFDTRTSEIWGSNNVAHVLCNVVSVVIALREQGRDPTLILRPETAAHVLDIYRRFGIRCHLTDEPVEGRILAGTIDNDAFQLWRAARFGAGFETARLDGSGEGSGKILIARRSGRTLINEAEVRSGLESEGFETVYFEDMSISDQWARCRNARRVVALHGAAMANLGFCAPGTEVVELCHAGYFTNFYRRCLAAIHAPWAGVTSRPSGDVFERLDGSHDGRAFADEAFEVDPASIHAALDWLESNR